MRRYLWVLALAACDDGGDGAPSMQVQLVDGAIAVDMDGVDTTVDDAAIEDAAVLDAAADQMVDATQYPTEPVPAAALPTYSGEACPTFESGRNAFMAGTKMRDFNLFLPPEPDGKPLLLIWHPLGSNAGQIGRYFDAQGIAAERDWIVAVPESLRTQTEWGYFGSSVDDLALFDDLLACLGAQYAFDPQRVYTTGFSAGALWSSYLIMHRAQHLNAALVLSGGVSEFTPYRTPEHALPVLLAWGGPTDQYGGIINFQETTFEFRDRLREGGHPVVTCEHAGGHVPPPGVTGWGIDFLAGHVERVAAPAFTDDAPYPETCVEVE